MASNTTKGYMPEVNYSLSFNSDNKDFLIRSIYGASMNDLFVIILKNMFQYSKHEEKRKFIISFSVVKDSIQHLHFENTLPDNTNEDKLNRIFEERVNNVARLQQEGGSGLVKAINIVKYEFANNDNIFTIKAIDGKCLVDVYFNLKNMMVR